MILANLGTSPSLSRRASTLLGALLLSEVLMSLELREGRRQVAVIVDEASRFITPDLAVTFAELRGYGCAMTLAAQSLSQLETTERKILETVMSCSETIISFRASFEDAARLAPQFLRYDPYKPKEENENHTIYFTLEEQLRETAELLFQLPDRQCLIKNQRGIYQVEVAEVKDADLSKEALKSLFTQADYYVRMEEEPSCS
jgi:type IV secretory pathway TraG/TraD family ATPase VirD4